MDLNEENGLRMITMGKTILLADDSMFMRMQIRDILTKMDHEVIGEASNGLEAVQLYEQLRPDVVLMDITMPEMDGIAALKEIKKINKDATVIMVSAMGQKAIMQEAKTAGSLDFIVKPFDEEYILRLLSSF